MGGAGFSALSSSNNYYAFRMQNGGNVVIYKNGHAIWATHTNGR